MTRSAGANRVVVALVGSGLLYELSYAIAGAAPDYRYSHWMVTCCCLGLVFAFATRWRAARPIGTPPHDDRSDRGDDPIS